MNKSYFRWVHLPILIGCILFSPLFLQAQNLREMMAQLPQEEIPFISADGVLAQLFEKPVGASIDFPRGTGELIVEARKENQLAVRYKGSSTKIQFAKLKFRRRPILMLISTAQGIGVVGFYDAKGAPIKESLGLPELDGSIFLPDAEESLRVSLPLAISWDEKEKLMIITAHPEECTNSQLRDSYEGLVNSGDRVVYKWKRRAFKQVK